MKFSKLFLVCALAATSLSALAQQETKTFIYGGDIYSADPKIPIRRLWPFRGVKLLPWEAIRMCCSRRGRMLHAWISRGYLLPGLIDSHAHVKPTPGFRRSRFHFRTV